MSHVTVLLEEAVAALALTPQSTVVDATLGYSGHAARICAALDHTGTYIGIDADPAAIARGREVLNKVAPTTHLVCDNFAHLKNILRSLHISTVNAIVADLGWRMDQFTEGGKGFSFQADEPLIMTYGEPGRYDFTAHEIVNDWSEEHIVTILTGYGEERYARRIATAIVKARASAPIATTGALVEIIEAAVPAHYRHGRLHPATRTFQALRMTVNDELSVLETFLADAVALLAPHGRLAIITFHSLEDRVVKHSFRAMAKADLLTILTKKPIVPSATELAHNPRARSAKLRIISKNEHPA